MAEIAKEVGTIGGIATVSVLHSFIPTHWLPFSIVGRAQNWSISRILLVSKFSPPYPMLFRSPMSSGFCDLAANIVSSIGLGFRVFIGRLDQSD